MSSCNTNANNKIPRHSQSVCKDNWKASAAKKSGLAKAQNLKVHSNLSMSKKVSTPIQQPARLSRILQSETFDHPKYHLEASRKQMDISWHQKVTIFLISKLKVKILLKQLVCFSQTTVLDFPLIYTSQQTCCLPWLLLFNWLPACLASNNCVSHSCYSEGFIKLWSLFFRLLVKPDA